MPLAQQRLVGNPFRRELRIVRVGRTELGVEGGRERCGGRGGGRRYGFSKHGGSGRDNRSETTGGKRRFPSH
jgi:hypothetical protein